MQNKENSKENKPKTNQNAKAVFAQLVNKIDNLQKTFDEKIMNDEYKNKLFDNLHRELTDCRNQVYEKTANMMALDIIQLIDSVKDLNKIYKEKEYSEENYKKLLKAIDGISQDLEDVLYRQNIESFSVASDEVDAKKQKIIQILETQDENLNNTIAQRCACGYEKNDKILRQERIKIYKYKKEN